MAKKLNSVLGIDIGSSKIKVCEVKTQGREPVVTALGMIDTPEGSVDHTGIFNPEAVGTALKQLLTESGATTNSAVVSIAGQASVLVRTLEVPRMEPSELKDHMVWEINRNIPFAETTIVSDFKSLGADDPSSQNMDVVMAIAPQTAIDTVMACIKRAGRSTAAIDVEPLSMARSLQTSYADVLADKTVCMVDMGHKTTSINIYKGSKLLMPRQVPLGGEMFTKAIADTLGVSMTEAESVKLEKGEVPQSAIEAAGQPQASYGDYQNYNPFAEDFTTPTYGDPSAPTAAPGNPFENATDPYAAAGQDSFSHITDPYGINEPPAAEPTIHGAVPDAFDAGLPPVSGAGHSLVPSNENPETLRIYQAMAPVLEELVAEVRRSIDYYRSRGGEVDVVELSGGGTMLRGLTAYVSKAIGIPCDAYDPLRHLNMNIRKVAPAFVEEHRQEFAVAVGNGLHIFFD